LIAGTHLFHYKPEVCTHGPSSILWLAGCACVLLLQGCLELVSPGGCNIKDVYGLIDVDGKTGFTKNELAKKGIALCARHMARKETYKGEHACSEPDEVFPDGFLPNLLSGDLQALLLVRCPTGESLPNNNMQRITCSSDYWTDEDEDRYVFYFDGGRRPVSCSMDSHRKANESVILEIPFEREMRMWELHETRKRANARNMNTMEAVVTPHDVMFVFKDSASYQ